MIHRMEPRDSLPEHYRQRQGRRATPHRITSLRRYTSVNLTRRTTRRMGRDGRTGSTNSPTGRISRPVARRHCRRSSANRGRSPNTITSARRLPRHLPKGCHTNHNRARMRRTRRRSQSNHTVCTRLRSTKGRLQRPGLKPLHHIRHRRPATRRLASRRASRQPRRVATRRRNRHPNSGHNSLRINTRPRNRLTRRAAISFHFQSMIGQTLLSRQFITYAVNNSDRSSASISYCKGSLIPYED